ncbi:MAG: MarR family transcriptional regulator [Spirochaetaceae bacterium]|nr:MarR family transcriptional regulator [Spirochaetaceae bacterium]
MDRREISARAAVLFGRIYDGLDARARKHDESSYEGLTFAEARALNAVARLQPLSLAELAAATGVKSSAASITLERLVGKGLAERRQGAKDRRSVEITTTARGRETFAAMERWTLEDSTNILDTLDADEVETFVAMLEKIAMGL